MPAFLPRSAKILIVFALVGPLVGLAVFSLGRGVFAVIDGHVDGMWLSPFFILYGLFFAHFVGLPWALVAGLCASVIASRMTDRRLWIGAMSGVVSFVSAALFKTVQIPLAPAYAGGAGGDTFTSGIAAVMLLVHVIAATASWLIARRFA